MSKSKLSIVVLAAGQSSRMGKPKQLLPVNGQPMLRRVAKTALSADNTKVTVVLGANAEACTEVLASLPVQIVVNKNWENGMGSSINSGLASALKQNPETDAVLLLLADQPFVTSKHINALQKLASTSKKSIIASSYSEIVGVPILLKKKYFSDLLKLNANKGAKLIVKANPDDIQSIPFPEAAKDIDTLEDFQNYIENKAG
ncbi:nucleotidyltransferase family protein [Flammeovirgaceae bacterium SG7u.111]|nr:nucleotidyltransferase family protein [Flammeovirgaceae bacterium SG7u.132]WPO36258.1 nucleotidyltransferase family protein [Flammeovirgaceae bacterium SG7u.111]